MAAPIAIQLYTLREAMQGDFASTVTRLADIGYRGVEPFGGMPVSPAEAARIFADLKLEVPSMHAALPLGDDQAAVLEAAEAYGLNYIICPYLPRENFATLDGIKRTCDLLNRANAAAMENGFGFGYHNHDGEMVLVEGKPAYQHMLDHLDPAVAFEVDVYWVQVGGQDPAAVVAGLGERAPLLHIKDGPADDPQADMTAVGTGAVDIPGVVQAGAAAAEWLIVELDRCATDMMRAVEESYTYLVQEGLGHGRK